MLLLFPDGFLVRYRHRFTHRNCRYDDNTWWFVLYYLESHKDKNPLLKT